MILLMVAVSLIWYVPLYKKQGVLHPLEKKYCVIGVLVGMIPVVLLSLVFETLCGYLFNLIGLEGTAYQFVKAFLSVGTVEELLKFAGAYLLLKLIRPERKIDYVLIFGAVGLGVHLVERLFGGGNLFSAILGGIMCYHIFWQYFMGIFWYDYEKAKAAGEPKGKYLALALGVPILLHGINDFIAFMIGGSAGEELTELSYGWLSVYCLWLIVFVFFIVFTLKACFRIAEESREAENEELRMKGEENASQTKNE